MILSLGKSRSDPIAVSSKLGQLFSGPYKCYNDSTAYTNASSNLVLDYVPQHFCILDTDENFPAGTSPDENAEISGALKDFLKNESIGLPELNPPSPEETSKTEPQKDFEIRFNGERYKVKSEISDENLPDNYDLCFKRLKSLQVRLIKDSELFREYNDIFQDQLEKGIIERVPRGKIAVCKLHYLCHRAVIHKDHDTTELRIVFDGSAKPNPGQPSLNDFSQLDEKFMPSIFHTLLRFCCNPY